jgi:uncharacterized RmlC-like cupin family protein
MRGKITIFAVVIVLALAGHAMFLSVDSLENVPAALPVTPFTASAQGLPKQPSAILPDKIPWKNNPYPDTRQAAYVVGALDKRGMYIQLVRWLPNTTAKAHSHSDDRYGFVVSGTFFHGVGDKFDASELELRPAGTFFTEPAGVSHFGATRTEGTVLYFVGSGPSTTNQIEK